MKKIKALYLISCREAEFGDRTIPYGEATFYAMPYPVSPTHGE